MKSVQLGSAACDGQMAKSTWKHKWVCTRRRAGIWLMDATGDAGGGSTLSSHPAEMVLFAPPQGPSPALLALE